MDDIKAKKAIKDKIAAQKADRANKFGTGTSAVTNVTPSAAPTPVAPSSTNTVKKEYDSCEVQVRLTNGQVLKQTFKPTDTLRVVYNWISTNRTDDKFGQFSLITQYPKKTFTLSMLDAITLKDADLVPRGTLIVSHGS